MLQVRKLPNKIQGKASPSHHVRLGKIVVAQAVTRWTTARMIRGLRPTSATGSWLTQPRWALVYDLELNHGREKNQ